MTVIVIIALYTGVMMIVTDGLREDEPEKYGLDEAPAFDEPSSTFFDVLASIIHSVWDTILFVLGAMTFNVPGAPVPFRFTIGVIVIGSLAWSIVTLIRGN
jgi:hypothetical protein